MVEGGSLLLAEDVFAGPHGHDRDQGVPVRGRVGVHPGDVFPVDDLAEVGAIERVRVAGANRL
jgi:hypothetical protein